jgi:hypothetical protein
MSLPKTQWRYLGSVPCVSANTTTIIEGIRDLGLATTYPDGSQRTPGSGSAGTYSLVSSGTTRVLHIDPAVRTIANKIVLCADTGGTTNHPNGASRLPTLASGESDFPTYRDKSGTYGPFWGASGPADGVGRFSIFSTIIKNPGAYSHWTTVSPFTSGSFYGYYRSLVTNSSGFTGNAYVYESTDCLAVAFVGSQNYFLLAGAIIDPESPDTTLDSESDGKLYGMMAGTFASNWNETFAQSGGNGNVANSLLYLFTGLRNSTLSVFQPSTSNILRVTPMTWLSPASTVLTSANSLLPSAAMFTRSGRLVKIPITYRSLTSGHTLGRLRDIYLFSNSRMPRKLMNGNVPLGYAFGPSDSGDVNCVFLEH